MLAKFPAVDRSSRTAKEERQWNNNCSKFSECGGSHQGSETSLILVGKPIYLQQQFSVLSSTREATSQLRSQNKTYSRFSKDVLEEKKRVTKPEIKKLSGGVRRASVHRRQDQQKLPTVVVNQKKSVSKHRRVTTRQPLVMCTMDVPGKHAPYEEASQMFSSTEEAKAMLKRLHASRNHACMTAESVNISDVRQGQEKRSGLLEKSNYLEDTYEYLFHRHVQTLNEVIRQQEQLEADEAHGLHRQKHRKQVIQLCCEDVERDDTPVIINPTNSSNRHNSSIFCHHSSSCDGTAESNSQDSNQNPEPYCINSNVSGSPTSCSEDGNKFIKNRCEKDGPSRMSENHTGRCETTHRNNSDDSSLNINAITDGINALQTQEVPPKPIITFNHVSTSSESSSTFRESESLTLKQAKGKFISSTIRSRSSSPLLEVPVPLEDLTSEMMRPPIN